MHVCRVHLNVNSSRYFYAASFPGPIPSVSMLHAKFSHAYIEEVEGPGDEATYTMPFRNVPCILILLPLNFLELF